MGKRVESTVKKFPGFVVFMDPIPDPTCRKLEYVMRNLEKDTWEEVLIPVLIDAVEAWELENFVENPTPETFPGSPRASYHRLVAWLLGEITSIYTGNEDDDPNE